MRLFVLLVALLPVAAAAPAWTASEAVAGQPAFALLTHEGEGHQEYAVQIVEGGVLRFSSAYLHEHDAVAAVAWTPERGPLLWRGLLGDTFEAQVEVAPAAAQIPGPLALQVEDETPATAPTLARVSTAGHGQGPITLRDDAGRLLLSSWWTASSTATLHEGPATMIDGFLQGAGVEAVSSPLALDDIIHAPVLADAEDSCGWSLDPDTSVPGRATFGPWTDIRVVTGTPAKLTLEVYEVQLADWSPVWSTDAADPFGIVTVRPPGVGSYRLTDGSCGVSFDVLPDPLFPVGTLAHDVTWHGTSATLALTAFDAEGEKIPHYEFATTVARLGADGAIVLWTKFHGHAGYAEFTLHTLAPGTYEVVVDGSPQSPTAPPVEPLRFTFEVPASETTDTTTPLGPLALVVLLALVLWRRR